MNITEYIKKIPKAELHLHIEGSFEPELMFEIAQRNKVEIPYQSVEEVKKAYQFSCLQDFLDIYYAGASVLLYEKDFYDLTMAYFKHCAEENVVHTEIMFDPQTHTKRGISFETVINGIQKAREDAKEKYGISSLLIMSYLRHLSEEDAFETLEQSLPYKHLIKAVGLDSSEKGNAQYPSAWELSSARATACLRYLINHNHISPSLLRAVAYGDIRPLVPNTTPENSAKNRRVEFNFHRPEAMGNAIGF